MTAERLRELLHYDPETGIFTWLKVSRKQRQLEGGAAGCVSRCGGRRYSQIGIAGRYYSAHRLAFLWMTGSFPAAHVDHVDGNGFNNRWNNLRQATPRQNAANRHVCLSKTGVYGVTFIPGPRRKPWRADINRATLGYFATAQEAREARRAEAIRLYGEFASGLHS